MSKKVLFVDDENEILETFGEILSEFDKRLIFALSCRDAIEMLKVHDVGLVISDYWMPRGKGSDILDYINQNNPSICFCYFTGRAPEEFEKTPGLDHIYSKPDDMKLVLDRIRAFLRQDID